MERKLIIIQTTNLENKTSKIELQNLDKISHMEVMGILRYLEKTIFVQCCKDNDKLKSKK